MKNLILMAVAAVAGVAFAMPSTHWAAAYTKAAKADTSGGAQEGYYSGYYCTAETAQALFGVQTVADVTAYFVDNFDKGVQQLKDESAKYGTGAGAAGELGRSLSGYDHGQYVLNTTYGDSLAAFGSAYLAVLIYDNDAIQEVRVMSSGVMELANGNAYFSDADPTTICTFGAWTTVPEPTSGLLMLLGMAGLALRRRCA